MRQFVCFLLLLLSPLSNAQDGNIHWAYAAYFGTGHYKVADNKSVYVIRPTPRWTWKEHSYDTDSGERKLGWRFKFPVAIGLHEFDLDDLDGLIDPGNLGSISVVPGFELNIPINRRWVIQPTANFGWGTLLDTDETAFSYWASVKSRVHFNAGKLNWWLLNSIGYTGYTPDKGKIEDMYPLMAGLEFSYPMPDNWTISGAPLNFYWHGSYTHFEKDLDFVVQRQTVDKVTNTWELGASVGIRYGKFELGPFKLDRFGLGFGESDAGLRGVRIYFRSIWDYL